MGFNQILEIGRRSLRAQQARMDTVSQNLANAGSEDYNRRRLTTNSASVSGQGLTIQPPDASDRMNGVNVSSFERVRDSMYTSLGRDAQTGLSASEEEARILQGLESIVAADSEGSLQNVMNEFFNAWGDVADNPTDEGVRQALLGSAETMTDTFQRIGQEIDRLRGEAASALENNVDRANSLTSRIAELNQEIQTARASGSPDLSAEDERDALTRELAELAPIQVDENDSSGYRIAISGMSVVQGDSSTELNLNIPDNLDDISEQEDGLVTFDDTGIEFQPDNNGGEIGAQLHTLDQTLPEVRGDLNYMVEGLVDEVNDLHTEGFDLNDNDDNDFFTIDEDAPLGTIELDITDPSAIAASAEEDEPGNADVALDIFNLRNPVSELNSADAEDFDGAFDDQAIEIQSFVGSQVRDAEQRATAQSASLAQIDSLEEGVSGVSLDEELTNMIEHQQAFAASSRVIQTAQEMMDTLLAM